MYIMTPELLWGDYVRNGEIREDCVNFQFRGYGNQTVLMWLLYNRQERAAMRFMERYRNVINVELRDENGMTVLLIACLNRMSEIILMLLGMGVDVNVRTSEGITPLMYVVNMGLEVVRGLVERGADVNAVLNGEEVRDTVLKMSLDSPEVLEYLLSRGADVNYCREGGWTVLMLACWRMMVGCVKMLVEHGNINCDVQNLDGNTALMILCLQYRNYMEENGHDEARMGEYFECIALLMSMTNLELKNDENKTANDIMRDVGM